MLKKCLIFCLPLFANAALAEESAAQKDAKTGFQKSEKIISYLADYKKEKGHYPPDLQEMDGAFIDDWLKERKFIYVPMKNATDYAMAFEGRGFLLFFNFRCVRGPEGPWQCSPK